RDNGADPRDHAETGVRARLRGRLRAGTHRGHRAQRQRHRQGDACARLPSDGLARGRSAQDLRLVSPKVTVHDGAVADAPGLTALVTAIVDRLARDAPVLTIGRTGGRAPNVVPGATRLELGPRDRTIPFPDESFGCVVSLDVVDGGSAAALAGEHVRVCRPGGVVVIAGDRPDVLNRLELPDLRERRLWPETGRGRRGRWRPRPDTNPPALVPS